MEVDAFLADSVVSVEGKLYVQGGGWNNISVGELPAVHDRIGIGIVIRVPYTATNQPHELKVHLEDEDGQVLPIGDSPAGAQMPDGRMRSIGGQFNMGRPAELPAGDEQIMCIAVNINALRFELAGAYSFVIEIDGAVVKRLPFRILQRFQPGPVAE